MCFIDVIAPVNPSVNVDMSAPAFLFKNGAFVLAMLNCPSQSAQVPTLILGVQGGAVFKM